MKHAQKTEKYIRLIFNSYISDDDFFQKSIRIIDTNSFFLEIFKAKRGCALCNPKYGSHVKAKVKSKDGLTSSFVCNLGVRQGCTLSPWLFAMYIIELVSQMEQSASYGIFIHEDFHNVMLLLFADDLTLIADTPVELQIRLNCLENYCEKWNMTVNMDKSNIIGGNLSKNEKWYIKDELIKVVSYYKYLGSIFLK